MQDDWKHMEKAMNKGDNVQPKSEAPTQAKQAAESDKRGFDWSKVNLQNRYVFAAIVAVILLLAIWLRLGMLQYQGFFEPDGFFHYSVIRAAIANGFSIPDTLGISGLSLPHNAVTEPDGFYWTTLVPYFVLRYFGVSYYTIMRLIPVLFGLLDAIGAYFLVRLLLKSRLLSLLAMLLVAISSGDIARTAALIYRGDGFVSAYVIAALILTYLVFRYDDKKRYYFAAASGIMLSFAMLVWAGAAFAVVIFITAILLIGVYGFLVGNKRILENSLFMSGSLLLAYILEHIYMLIYILRNAETLSGPGFFVFYVPAVLISLVGLELLNRMDRLSFVRTMIDRLKLLVAVFIVGFAVMLVFFGYYIVQAETGGGIIASQNTLLSTIQELQPPTYNFLWSSFGIQLYLAPLGMLLFILFAKQVDGNGPDGGTMPHYNYMPVVLGMLIYYAAVFFFNTMVVSQLTSQMSVFGFISISPVELSALLNLAPVACALIFVLFSERARGYSGLSAMSQNVSVGFIIVLSYFVVTFYLDMGAQRFNSLLSVPMALFSAYALYATCMILYIKAEANFRLYIGAGVAIIILALLVYSAYITSVESANTPQADGINQLFLNAMAWMRNNTAPDATVLALWPDGSVVEGWANRTSLMDSVGGQTQAIIVNYSNFLFNISNTSKFLYQYDKPEYIIGRQFWLQELGGIATEGNVTNESRFGYIPFSGYTGRQNSTERLFEYTSQSYTSVLTIQTPTANETNQSNLVTAYIKCNENCPGGIQSYEVMKYVMFYNESSGSFYTLTSPSNQAVNVTLMIFYSGNRTVSAAILGAALPESNLFKIGLLCRVTSECPYSNPNVTFTSVYENNDTTILKVNYKNG